MEPGKENISTQTKETVTKKSGLNVARRKLGTIIKGINETFAITQEKVPLEEITQQKIAKTIINHIGNPLRQKIDDNRYANPFDITDVITNMGYVGILSSTDYLKKFPKVYAATRQALYGLEQEGVLESKDYKPNAHNESKYYKVTDKEKLRELSMQQIDNK